MRMVAEGGDGANGDGSNGGTGQENATGSVSGEAAPVRVALSGGNLPSGLQDSADGCWTGICTDWNVDDVVVGDKSFGTGFVIKCTLACGEHENGWFQMKLADRYTKLDATFGIAADSRDDDGTRALKLNVINQGTGQVLHTGTLERGRSYALTGFDISGVGMLRISFEGALGGVHGAVGAPVVRR
ncbi:hypothetical protein [Streptomyces sp. CAI-85]|uniref:hypothetical protein n=1 Tax=Streptomyces sp. CAI-85 TaxID=1472662 RepID=UPI00158734A4|nr:hypothetical protein [Streptomyces sp. CAI-85]NUV58808.1 hypothetical protein [Streptomyces sp. CAI-85]